MARLPTDQINRIKRDVSLLKLVESQGYEITKQGKDHVVHCPFHEDDTPSCVISPKTNLFHCFGCGEGGSVIDWVMKLQGLSFRRACELLLNDIGAVVDAPAKPVKRSQSKTLSSSLAADLLAAPEKSLNRVTDFYHQTLLASPEALGYLEKRGLNDPKLIKQFKLGFANRTLGYHLPGARRRQGEQIRKQLREQGILRESGHEHFNGSLVIPLFSEQGEVVEVYGRKVTRDTKLSKGTPLHLYLPGPHAGVWNAQGLVDRSTVILCEALLDAMTFWVHGFTHVTASYGTQGFTDEHLSVFKQCGVQQVLVAYDRDAAGETAAQALAEQLQGEGIACYRVVLPKDQDVNGYALQLAQTNHSREQITEALGRLLRAAASLGNASALPATTETATPLAASSATLPAAPAPMIDAQITDQDMSWVIGEREYRLRGLLDKPALTTLTVNLQVRSPVGLHMDTLDIYSSKQRQRFVSVAAVELALDEAVIKKDVGQALLKLELLQEEKRNANERPPEKSLSTRDEQAALALLQDPGLIDRIIDDLASGGVVGEATNTLVGYLAATSRKLAKPLAIVIQSTSAAGKSALMDAVLNLMPIDDRVQYSAMTGQSLFYMGQTNLKHKILAIAEEEGASNASYALKLLQSEGKITIASTGKDENTGDLVTKEYTVEGPVMLFLTTTAIDIDEELLNRCLVLTVNESREQTRAIHRAQRQKRTLAGLSTKLEKDRLTQLHRHAQQLLKPLAVINPYADQLTFLDTQTRTRRDHEKYLTLIDSIALLHQYQREIKTLRQGEQTVAYMEVQRKDIEIANRLAHDVLGRTLDELPAQTRKLLKQIQEMVAQACDQQGLAQSDYRFTRRDIRAFTGWSDNQLKVHCARLADLEYLLVHSGHRGKVLQYELLYAGECTDQSRWLGLLDPQNLRYDANKLGSTTAKLDLSPTKLGSSCPQVGPKLDSAKPLDPLVNLGLSDSGSAVPGNTVPVKNNSASHPSGVSV